MQSENNEEVLQEDLVQIASVISESNYNIRHFKKQHIAKPLNITTQSQKARTVSRLFTESNTQKETFYPSTHSKTVAQGLNKSLKFQDTFIAPHKRKNEVTGHPRSKTFFSKSSDRYGDRQNNKLSRSGQGKSFDKNESQLLHHEKAWKKGKIQEHCLQEWLNAICIEFFPNQYFDKNIPNSSLKKLGIDQNSLIAKGLHPKDVSRLYRGLFVFGMGFNSLVRELTNNNSELKKIIWRIYSTILEYCSNGNLQTVVGDIQRENSLKLVDLTSELQRKQLIIQKNEELNEKKNSEIFKEIKQLRQDNFNLQNEKTVLVDQYNSTEQAFSEEVNLRLKFETKINQIYGLHRELGNKHQKLYHELVNKAQQLRTEAEKYFLVVDRISEYKEVIIDLREQLTYYRDKSKRESDHLHQSSKEIVSLTEKVTKLEYAIEFLRNQNQEIQVKEKQWGIERANMNVVLDLREKSTKETSKQYQITLEENNRLYISLSDQRRVMEEYEKEKKNFNTKIISIVSENSYNKRKCEQITRKFQNLQEKYNQLLKTKQQLVCQNEIQAKNEENLKKHFQVVEGNISEMHKINMAQSEELSSLKLFYSTMSKVLSDKNSAAESMSLEKSAIMEQYEQLKTDYNELFSNFKITEQKCKQMDQAFLVKTEKLNAIRSDFEQKEASFVKLMTAKEEELQIMRNSLEKILREYKNQKFQRNSLNTMYSQTLKIIESKNQEQKNLNVRISLMEGELTKHKNRYLVLETNMVKFISDFGEIQQKLEETINHQRDELYSLVQYRHPMIVEDLQVQVAQLHTKNEANEDKIFQLETTLQRERACSRQELEKSSSGYRWELNKVRVESQRIIQTLKNEIKYQKEQNTNQKIKLEQLETVAETYRKKIYEKSTSEREQVYRFMIEEKRKQIETMFQEMERVQDELAKAKKSQAQMMVRQEKNLAASQDELRQSLEESIKKELSQEYELKFVETQRALRAQYLRKEQQMREDREKAILSMPITEILKLKNLKPEEVLNEINQKMGNRYLNPKEIRGKRLFEQRQQVQNREETRKRQEISRLLKNATEYYDQ